MSAIGPKSVVESGTILGEAAKPPPVCGSPPMTSAVVGWPNAHNTRFCACSLCGTMWNVVRVKCVLCTSTDGISFREIDGASNVKGETCEKCRGYAKILYQVNDPALEPMADDVATLGLDMLLAARIAPICEGQREHRCNAAGALLHPT